jgi:hypothetical protein
MFPAYIRINIARMRLMIKLIMIGSWRKIIRVERIRDTNAYDWNKLIFFVRGWSTGTLMRKIGRNSDAYGYP